MPTNNSNAEKILARLKGLAPHLQSGEEPVAAFPAIWDNGQDASSTPCDVVITNERIMGFYSRSFPRERLFLDALSLPAIKNVTLRQKSHEPLFRELMISAEKRKVYVRAPRNKIEDLYASLKISIDQYGSTNLNSSTTARGIEDSNTQSEQASTSVQEQPHSRQQTIYGRQEIQRPFETTITAIALLFAGGIVLEIVGIILWSMTSDTQIGLPLCFAGFFAVAVSIWLRRRQR